MTSPWCADRPSRPLLIHYGRFSRRRSPRGPPFPAAAATSIAQVSRGRACLAHDERVRASFSDLATLRGGEAHSTRPSTVRRVLRLLRRSGYPRGRRSRSTTRARAARGGHGPQSAGARRGVSISRAREDEELVALATLTSPNLLSVVDQRRPRVTSAGVGLFQYTRMLGGRASVAACSGQRFTVTAQAGPRCSATCGGCSWRSALGRGRSSAHASVVCLRRKSGRCLAEA